MSHRRFPCHSRIKQERNKQFQTLYNILTWELQKHSIQPSLHDMLYYGLPDINTILFILWEEFCLTVG